MAFDLSNIDWGGLLTAGLNLYGSKQNAGANQQTANQYAQQTKYNPYNILAGNQGVLFNGNSAAGSLSPQYQQLQNQLTGGAGGLLGNIGNTFQNGGINPFLQGSFDQYNGGAPQNSQDLSGQFNDSAKGFLGGLGSFDPNQAAQGYTNNLRSQAQPQNQRAAEGLAQGLFNSGRLGSTGGANIFGNLIQSQNQQDLGFQLAGQQYGGQEQSRIAGLAGQQAQLGSQFGQQQYDQGNQRAQQRFQNAMSLFGAGQQNAQGQLGAGLGLLQGSQGLDQGLLQAIQTGGYLGGASSSANQQAYNPSMQAGVAGNNASSAGWLGLAQSLGIPDMLGGQLGKLFGGGGGASPVSNPLMENPGVDMGLLPNTDQWRGITDPKVGGFNGAGGQATNFPSLGGGAGDLAAGIGDSLGLSQFDGAGATGSWDGKSGMGLGDIVGKAGDALGIYGGIKQGGVAGYGKAAVDAASLAGYNVPGAGYLGAATQLAKGNVVGAGSSALMTAAGPYAVAANVAASLINKSLTGHGDENRNFSAWTQATGAKLVTQPVGRTQVGGYALNGKLLDGEYAKDLAGAFYGSTTGPDGDKEGWAKKYADLLANPKDAKLARGYVWDGTKIVRG